MKTISFIALWNAYFLLNVIFAWWNVDIVHRNQKIGKTAQINHFLWAAFYFSLCATQWFLFHDYYFIASILLLHLSVFPVVYNRDMGLPAFWLSKTSKALTDRIQVSIGLKSSVVVNIGAFILSIALLIKSFR